MDFFFICSSVKLGKTETHFARFNGEARTWKKSESFVVTDLLVARTGLRLGESLACMVYLHRWNYPKHFVCFNCHPNDNKCKNAFICRKKICFYCFFFLLLLKNISYNIPTRKKRLKLLCQHRTTTECKTITLRGGHTLQHHDVTRNSTNFEKGQNSKCILSNLLATQSKVRFQIDQIFLDQTIFFSLLILLFIPLLFINEETIRPNSSSSLTRRLQRQFVEFTFTQL